MSGTVLLMTLVLSMLVAPLADATQQLTKVYRIGWLSSDFPRPDRDPHPRETFLHVHVVLYMNPYPEHTPRSPYC
jgi:hypothetical protein